jgi:hypothetical protein
MRSSLRSLCLSLFLLVIADVGCGSGDDKKTDTGVTPDAPVANRDLPGVNTDLPVVPPDAGVDTPAVPADTRPGVDLPVATIDVAPAVDASGTSLDTAAIDQRPVAVDGSMGSDGASSTFDVASGKDTLALTEAGAADLPISTDAFDPGPVVPVVVNSSNTATYNLANGTWKVFSFPATAGQIYAISGLPGGIVHGYLGTMAAVSPTNFTKETDSNGDLIFTATASQTYYLAVGVSGGGANGSFQVADGGQLLIVGANSVTLTAPTLDDYYFFRFPISAGKGYRIQVASTGTASVGLGVSPRADRSSGGQLSTPAWSTSGGLPLDDTISSTSVALSISGFYYLYVNVHADMSLTITLTEA